MAQKSPHSEMLSSPAGGPTRRSPHHINPDLIPQIARLFDAPKYSDLTLKCQGRPFEVHRLIVCLQSKPLAAYIDSNLDASTGVVDLPDDDANTIERMLDYLYKGTYDDGCALKLSTPIPLPMPRPNITHPSIPPPPLPPKNLPNKTAKTTKTAKTPKPSKGPSGFTPTNRLSQTPIRSPTPASIITPCPTPPPRPASPVPLSDALLSNVLVYILAEKYEIPTLKMLAARKYEKVMPLEWDNVYGSFIASLSLMYAQTPATDRVLKDIAVAFVHTKAGELAEKEGFATLCKEHAELAYDMFMASLPVKTQKKRFPVNRCEICGTINSVSLDEKSGMMFCDDCNLG